MLTYSHLLAKAKKIEQQYRELKLQGRTPFHVPEKGLGWTVAPSSRTSNQLYTSNELGFRITSYEGSSPDDRPDVSFWGNSIVFGGEVADQESWLWLLQENLGNQYQVHNGGVAGYGTDQGLLRLSKRNLGAFDQVFLGYSTADLVRNINIQRFFVHQGTDLIFLKPRFELIQEDLRFIEPPFADYENMVEVLGDKNTKVFLKKNDPFYPGLSNRIMKILRNLYSNANYYGKRNFEYAMKLTINIFKRFYSVCSNENVRGVALLLPVYTGIYQSGCDFDILIDWFEQLKYPYLDARNAFEDIEKSDLGKYFNPHNHYTSLAGKKVAEYVADYLSRN